MNAALYRSMVVYLVLLSGCDREEVLGAAPDADALAIYGALGIEVLAQPVEVEGRADGSVAAVREATRAGALPSGRDTVIVGAEPGDVELHLEGLPALRIREEDASGPAERVGGAITRRRTGGRVYWTLAPGRGAEEWLDLDEGVALADRAVAHWTVDGAALRELPDGGGVHVLGEDGAPIVHVSAPRARTHDGEDVLARLRVEDDRIALYVDAGGRRVLVDPLWVPTGTMLTARALDEDANVAVELDGGIVWPGGSGVGLTALATVERYDIATGVWTSLSDLPSPPRRGHVAVALLDGRLLVFGGDRNDSGALYDPELGSWTLLPALTGSRRSGAQATLLSDGRVLVTGGWTGYDYADPAQLFDPATDGWTSAGSIGIGRLWHTAVRLPDGRVLIAGGTVYSGTGDPRFNTTTTATARLYDPASGAWSNAGALSQARSRPRAVLLQTGRVLVAGGVTAPSGRSTRADLYDPVTGTWSVTGSLSVGRDYHSLTLLPDGRVLAAGGQGPSGVLATTEIYSPATGAWTPGPSLRMPRADHASALLPNGRVLVAGGGTGPGRHEGITATSEILVEDTCGDGVLQAGEGCDDGNHTNGDCCSAACTIEVAGTVCRAGTGCDASERCDGVTPACPADALASAGDVCRPAAGACDIAEVCDGASAACPEDGVAPAGEVCREAAGECDATEVCTGSSSACPTDAARPEGDICGSAPSGDCDAADVCVGAVGAEARCEARYRAPEWLCRAATGDCDVPESCSGDASACPADSFAPSGTTCRPLAGDCDLAEVCPGDAALCPADALRGLDEVCRPAAGECDVAETCTGGAAACPSDVLVAPGSVCRPAAGECDVAEACSGAATCPVDLLAASVVCRASVSECDAEETCTGSGAACPSDASRAGAACGAPTSSACDAPDVCVGDVGASAGCEPRLAPAGTECRAARCEAGLEESSAECDGASLECPSSTSRPCWPFACGESACVTSCSADGECGAGAQCAAGSCAAVPDAGVLLDGGSGELDAGRLDAGSEPVSDAAVGLDGGAAADAGSPVDAGSRVDAGSAASTGGCGCRASGSGHGWLPPFAGLALLASIRRALARRRAGRQSAHSSRLM